MAQGNKNGLHGEDSASFEGSFRRLQEVVAKLSEGNLTLQEALSAFEEGMALAERCTQMLDAAELRLKQVSAQATRQAMQALDELETVSRMSPAADEVEGIVAVELESFETRLVFDVSDSNDDGRQPALERSEGTDDVGGGKGNMNLAYSPLPGERKGASRQNTPPDRPTAGKGEQGQRRFNPGDELDLDPLFDEDD